MNDELDDIRSQYPDWIIRPHDVSPASGPGLTQYVAKERETGRARIARSLPELEVMLDQVSKKSE